MAVEFSPAPPRHIGIVACSAEGAALCYRTICLEGAQVLGPHQHPPVSLHTYPLGRYMQSITRDDWQEVGELMLSSAHKLAAIGADVLICPDNTLHQAFPYVEPRSPRPWLHIARVVAAEAARRGWRCVGLTGTRYLLDSNVYPDALAAHGIRWLRPEPSEALEINRIIFEELVNAIFEPRAIAYFRAVIERMSSRGADAVVLGCTEIPLIIGDANSPLPTLDSTRLLARAALRWALDSAETASPAS